ncbi:MAG: hypothetical protein C4527_06730 [Candidatus Omnitrophota bacterium]|jgi:hypothetical protein|nr:MAG: hypothetical protein C4527_06730 [Candidatus Omnitrophota bacterium]
MSGFFMATLFKIMQFAMLILILYFAISLLSRRQAQTGPTSVSNNINPVNRGKWVWLGCGGCLGTFLLLILLGISPILLVNLYHEFSISDIDRQIRDIAIQKKATEQRIEKEIPEFVHLLYKQAQEIKSELEKSTDPSKKSYLTDELDEIARILLVLDKEESEFDILISELTSNERTLIRLRESEKLFGPEYEEYMEKSRATMIKSKAKLKVKLDTELGKNTLFTDMEVHQKVEELLK